MPIQYHLRDNRLTPDPNDCMAVVTASRTAELDDVIARMGERGSTVTKADILSVLEDFQGALESLLAEGANVTLPFANYSASIKGVFKDQTDTFDPARHQITMNLTPGKAIRDFLRSKVTVQKQETTVNAPNIVTFEDVSSGESKSLVTAGGFGKIVGHRLKFDPAVPEDGIFFIAADGAATKVDVVGQNTAGTLMFMIPKLDPGDYHLEVRVTVGSEVRVGRMGAVLSVA